MTILKPSEITIDQPGMMLQLTRMERNDICPVRNCSERDYLCDSCRAIIAVSEHFLYVGSKRMCLKCANIDKDGNTLKNEK